MFIGGLVMSSEWSGYSGGWSGGRGKGRGRGGGWGRGPMGYCVCINCGYKIPKQPGVRCRDMTCPRCGGRMVRE